MAKAAAKRRGNRGVTWIGVTPHEPRRGVTLPDTSPLVDDLNYAEMELRIWHWAHSQPCLQEETGE